MSIKTRVYIVIVLFKVRLSRLVIGFNMAIARKLVHKNEVRLNSINELLDNIQKEIYYG